ncbi:MAG: hypothetical protein P1U56_20635 [Saprospiraceae bacterium]|nr:hypothetical protein [Saprospiraceae bacterium]
MSVSFKRNISPMFEVYQANMNWRFDLGKYEDVKLNAVKIYQMIETKQMPPPNYNPFSDDQIAMFKQWMDEDYPE